MWLTKQVLQMIDRWSGRRASRPAAVEFTHAFRRRARFHRPMQMSLWLAASLMSAALWPSLLQADGDQDNNPAQVRPVPPLGIAVPEATERELRQGLEKLDQQLTQLAASTQPEIQQLLPDVQIFARAVRWGLDYREFFSEADLQSAQELLLLGQQRAADLLQGRAPWTKQTGPVVRGFVSRLDQSVQPYGIVVPDSLRLAPTEPRRLDIWLHGRGEQMGEVSFLAQRSKQLGEVAPPNTFVLHPYGRYSNAFKFAGEVDVWEALAAAQKHYAVDEDRISIRGFSMGGAGCWQFAVHYPDRWFAANPGAGFCETPEFLKTFQREKLQPTWYEEKLWRWYDCPNYAINLWHCPTVAYSGELDTQKQAADLMESALKSEKIALQHLIGPQTKHSIHPESKQEIERRLASLAKFGRDRWSKRLEFATYTLKYHQLQWLKVLGLENHWDRARVSARWEDDGSLYLDTDNVTRLQLDFPAGTWPHDIRLPVTVTMDGLAFTVEGAKSDRSFKCSFYQDGGIWEVGEPAQQTLAKRPGLQGPIDDAFMDSFIFVRPTGKGEHAAVEQWALAELERAIREWRRHFRGEARVKNDTEITPDDAAESNLILFGTPTSNRYYANLFGELPIDWTAQHLLLGTESYDVQHHGLIMVYPNPRNRSRYVVLNSGFTFREYAYLNNARQVPMLPDWAIVDVRQPATSQYPGKVVEANFFDEKWQLKPLTAR